MVNSGQLFMESIGKATVLHIPHSSISIPNTDGFILGSSDLQKELLLSTDIATDIIFNINNIDKCVFKYSRLYCDVERLEKYEPMDAYGRGIFYTKTSDGKIFRELNKDVYDDVMVKYNKHHKYLNEIVDYKQSKYGIALIIDCHSFNENKLQFEIDGKRPDICLGVDHYHTPQYLINYFVEYFRSYGFTVEINNPYSGTIIPVEFYGNNMNVQSIMIEVNKRLYMKEDMIVIPEKVVELNKIMNKIFNF